MQGDIKVRQVYLDDAKWLVDEALVNDWSANEVWAYITNLLAMDETIRIIIEQEK